MVQAKKRFSQNFLTDGNIVNHIVQVMRLQRSDNLLEIGPGTGALTNKLSTQCHTLTALEIDQDLITPLQQQFAQQAHVNIMHVDALTFAYEQLPPFRLVSNLPYHLSTALIRRFISHRQHIIDMHLMMQKEVALRLLSTQGKSRGWLSVLLELLCDGEYLFDVPPTSFSPVPNVDSAVIRLCWKANSLTSYSEPWLNTFQQILLQAFKQKRKTLFNNFIKSPWQLSKTDWDKININASLRAEQLPLADYIKLHDYIRAYQPIDTPQH